jgi:hypothetical protein
MGTQAHVDGTTSVAWFNPGDPATVQNPFQSWNVCANPVRLSYGNRASG